MKYKYDVRDFAVEVINKSYEVPVLADFWAEWCTPCKLLSPILEKLVTEANGRWVLAKVNTEQMVDVALEYKISSIPNVKLFFEGKVISEFVGALPEYQIIRWLEQSLPSKLRKEVEKASVLLSQNKKEEAQKLLENIIKIESKNEEAKALLAKAIVFEEPKRASELVSDMSDAKYIEIAESIRTFSRLFDLLENTNNLSESLTKQKYLNAIKDLISQKYESALEKFIDIIRNDRYYDDDGSRKACIAIFKFLGEEHETTKKYRRDFSSALY